MWHEAATDSCQDDVPRLTELPMVNQGDIVEFWVSP